MNSPAATGTVSPGEARRDAPEHHVVVDNSGSAGVVREAFFRQLSVDLSGWAAHAQPGAVFGAAPGDDAAVALLKSKAAYCASVMRQMPPRQEVPSTNMAMWAAIGRIPVR